MTDNAVEVTGVGKRFKRHVDRRNSIKERIVRGRARRPEDFWAVRDVTFEIPKGSVYGLIGHNGSGKSTLLKLISGVLRPDRGQVGVRGRVAGLIEVGAGFHPDLTGRENIYLNGSILGMTERDITARLDEIIAFSEIEGRFIDSEVKFYSSGMFLRLAFSVAAHSHPDVFLIDEILAVGDEPFQHKCLERIAELRKEGQTLVIVTHDLNLVSQVAERGIVLAGGKTVFDGPIEGAVGRLRGEG